MTNDHHGNGPLVCDLTALDPEQRERHQRLGEQIYGSIQEMKELPDGFAFRLSSEAEMCLTAAEFITLERLCCPFLAFVLELEPEGGPLWLKMRGAEEIKQFLQAELGLETG